MAAIPAPFGLTPALPLAQGEIVQPRAAQRA